MPRKKYGPPLRLPSRIRHLHQAYYLSFLNREVPDVSRRLTRITKDIVALFGKCPVRIDTVRDRLGLNVWYPLPREEPEKRSAWSDIENVFTSCIEKGNRENLGYSNWFRLLATADPGLRAILDYEERLKETLFEQIAGLDEKEIKPLRQIAECKYVEGHEVTLMDIQYSTLSEVSRYLEANSQDHKFKTEAKFDRLTPLRNLQKTFDLILDEFTLHPRWLARSAFIASWNGSGVLQTEGSFFEEIPKEALRAIRIALKKGGGSDDSFWLGATFPKPNPFTFEEDYWIYESFDVYEDVAVEAYRSHLKRYFDVIKSVLKQHGYKENRGDGYDFERLKWLVSWNTKSCSKDELLQEIVNTGNENIDRSTIDKAFRKFKSYDLPVRTRENRN